MRVWGCALGSLNPGPMLAKLPAIHSGSHYSSVTLTSRCSLQATRGWAVLLAECSWCAGVWMCHADQVQVQALWRHHHQAHQPARMGLRLGVRQVRLLPGAPSALTQAMLVSCADSTLCLFLHVEQLPQAFVMLCCFKNQACLFGCCAWLPGAHAVKVEGKRSKLML